MTRFTGKIFHSWFCSGMWPYSVTLERKYHFALGVYICGALLSCVVYDRRISWGSKGSDMRRYEKDKAEKDRLG